MMVLPHKNDCKVTMNFLYKLMKELVASLQNQLEHANQTA